MGCVQRGAVMHGCRPSWNLAAADIGVVGLAVMGENLGLNMASRGYTVAVYDRTTSKVDAFLAGRVAGTSIVGAWSPEELVSKLARPRRVMLMVQAGRAVDRLIRRLRRPLPGAGMVVLARHPVTMARPGGVGDARHARHARDRRRRAAPLIRRACGPGGGACRRTEDENGVATVRWPERLEVVEAMPLTATRKIVKGRLTERLSETPAPSM